MAVAVVVAGHGGVALGCGGGAAARGAVAPVRHAQLEQEDALVERSVLWALDLCAAQQGAPITSARARRAHHVTWGFLPWPAKARPRRRATRGVKTRRRGDDRRARAVRRLSLVLAAGHAHMPGGGSFSSMRSSLRTRDKAGAIIGIGGGRRQARLRFDSLLLPKRLNRI